MDGQIHVKSMSNSCQIHLIFISYPSHSWLVWPYYNSYCTGNPEYFLILNLTSFSYFKGEIDKVTSRRYIALNNKWCTNCHKQFNWDHLFRIKVYKILRNQNFYQLTIFHVCKIQWQHSIQSISNTCINTELCSSQH